MVSGGICKGESRPLALNQARRCTVQESYSTGLWNFHTAVRTEIPGQVLTGPRESSASTSKTVCPQEREETSQLPDKGRRHENTARRMGWSLSAEEGTGTAQGGVDGKVSLKSPGRGAPDCTNHKVKGSGMVPVLA